ncbi:MAG: hypothetical protein ACFFAO_21690 [Candidatus Hermodarchaeota archaeon]
MVANKHSVWTKTEIWLSLVMLIVSMCLATYMLFIKSWVFLVIYWLLWIIVFILGRYLVCRHCNLLGHPCPTWCFGIIGGLLYKRSEKKDFTEIKKSQFFLDVLLIALALIFPIIIYLYYIIVVNLILLDLFLLIVYFIIGIAAFLYHTKCCRKCTIKGCPLGPNHN